MDSNKKTTHANASSRRKFVFGVGILSTMAALAAVLKFPFSRLKNAIGGKPTGKHKTIKMLTQDGRLVEVDEALIAPGRKKITNSELQNWIKR